MQYQTMGTSAYKPRYTEQAGRHSKTSVKKGVAKNKAKSVRTKSFIIIAAVFVLTFTYLSRYVYIFGQHDDIAKMTKQLETIKMENDQLSVEIKSLTDSSRIEQYAMENLNLKKMDSNQIIYLDQTKADNMQRMTKERGNVFKGLFGLFSGVVEYLN